MTELIMKDGSRRSIAAGIAFSDLLKELPEGVRRNAVAFKAGNLLLDLRTNVPDGAVISVVTVQDPEALEVLRHSVSHLMALAVQELFPKVRFGIGPSIDDGFYYDFLMDAALNPEDLERIEEKMREMLKGGDLSFSREELESADAIGLFEGLGQPFKVELIRDLATRIVSIYRLGGFTDLCAGPHIPDIKMVKAFKLTSIAGAYWRGTSGIR